MSGLNCFNEARLQSVLNKWNVKGCSVSVVRRSSQNQWHEDITHFGVRNDQGDEFNDQTRFLIASNSKLFTALAAGIALLENGYENGLDTKIKHVIPEYTLVDPVAAVEISFADALGHLTGLPRHDHYMSNDIRTLRDELDLIRHMKPSQPYGSRNQYHNVHFDLVALIVEHITGKTFNDYVKEKILIPCGLDATTVSMTEYLESSNHSSGYWQYHETSQDVGQSRAILPGLTDSSAACMGAGRMSSNAVDMSKWLKILLDDGHHFESGKRILPADLIRRCMTGTVPFQEYASDGPEVGQAMYGLGLYEQSYRGRKLVEHVGALAGWMSKLCLIPELDTGIFIATNSAPWGAKAYEEIKFGILDEVFGLEPLDWCSQLLNQKHIALKEQDETTLRFMTSSSQTPTTRDVETLKLKMTGTYKAPAFHEWVIKEEHILASAPKMTQLPWLPYLWGDVQPVIWMHGMDVGMCWRYTMSEDAVLSREPIYGMPLEIKIDEKGDQIIGIGVKIIWGAGRDVPPPSGDTVEAQSEMYFIKTK